MTLDNSTRQLVRFSFHCLQKAIALAFRLQLLQQSSSMRQAMTTIEIVSEERTLGTIYRAICGEQQAIGTTPGQALDRIEQELAVHRGEQSSCTVVIVQRFLPDDLFTAQQQERLKELMDQFHEAIAVGEVLSPQVQEELEELVEAELKAMIERSAKILKQSQRDKK